MNVTARICDTIIKDFDDDGIVVNFYVIYTNYKNVKKGDEYKHI